VSGTPTTVGEARAALQQAHRRREALREAWDEARNPELLALAVLTIPRLLEAERCGIFVGGPDGARAWLVAGTGVTERQIEVPVAGTMVGSVLQSGKPLVKASLPGEDLGSDAGGYVVRTALTVPVLRTDGSGAVGCLQVLNRQGDRPFDEAGRALLEDIAFTMQSTLERVFDAQQILDDAIALDESVAALDAHECGLRSDTHLRVFPPLESDPDGAWLHHRWGGKRYPPFIDPGATRALTESWDTGPNDIFIATHQKVGTHLTKKFLLETVRALWDLPESHPFHSGDIGPRTVPWPEVLLSQRGRVAWRDFQQRTAGHPRLWFLHNAIEDMPARRVHPRSRFIVTVRDPRGTAVSQYHFWRRHPLLQVAADLPMDAFIDRFLEGDLYFGDYHQHVLGWVQQRSPQIRPEQVLVLRYGDLVEDKLRSVERIARFLMPSGELEPGVREQIAVSTGFESMKKEMTVNPRSFYFNPRVFFRSGKTRDWEAQLSPEQVARIDEKTAQSWAGTELEPPR